MLRTKLRAMLLTSTRAKPNAVLDKYSDYDVALIVRDIQPFVADKSWLQNFGDVLVAYWDPVQPEPGYTFEMVGNVVQYADGLKIDFMLWPVALFRQIIAGQALPHDLDDGYVVLLDKDHLTDEMRAPSVASALVLPRVGDTSSAQYDVRFGIATSETDINGQHLTRTLDVFGRLLCISYFRPQTAEEAECDARYAEAYRQSRAGAVEAAPVRGPRRLRSVG